MASMLLMLGVCFTCVGLLPLLRWLKCKVSKHHWRVCEINAITTTVNNRVAALELTQQQTMLVSFRFNGYQHSVLVGYDGGLFTRYKEGKICTLLVDKDNPQKVYNNSQLCYQFAQIWLLAGVGLCVTSRFL